VRRPAKAKALAAGLLCVLALPVLLSSDAFAHGDAPTTCENRYDATIVSMAIDNGTQTFDPIANPGLRIDAEIDAGYDVAFTLHTANQSSQNSTGSTWYRHSAFGFGDGVCVDDADAGEDIPLTVHVEAISGIPDNYTQSNVEWGSWPEVVQVTYEVVWHSSNESEPAQPPVEEQPPDEQDTTEPEVPQDDRQHSTDTDDFVEPLNNNVGTLISPFVFNKVQAASQETVVSDIEPDRLVINGTIASFSMAQQGAPLYILSGKWSMTVNDTSVSGFEANFTMARSDGLDRQMFSLGNLTAVNSQDVRIENDTMTIPSTIDVWKNGAIMARGVNVTIITEKLSVIKLGLDGGQVGIPGGPIYGVVDAIMRINNGEKLVIEHGQTD